MPTVAVPFSKQLREASKAQHAAAETTSFMSDLTGGRLGIDAYTRYTEQLWFVYAALEGCAQRAGLADDPVAGPFLDRGLARAPELARDLAYLRGPDWRSDLAPLPATAVYAARIEQCAAGWSGGYVAHHYTRYLGDLSGGQVVGARAEEAYGLTRGGDGVRFYLFAHIPNPAAYKRSYRARLDALPVGPAERLRIVEECRRAFDFNGAVLRALGRA